MIDEKAMEAAARAIYGELEGPVGNQDFARQSRQWERAKRLASIAIAALSPGSTLPLGSRSLEDDRGVTASVAPHGWHGPFGYLVCPIGLDESHWRLENDPEKSKAYVCLPLFAKEDPFKRTMIDAATDDPTSEALDLIIELRAENAALRERLGEPEPEKPDIKALLARLGHGGRGA